MENQINQNPEHINSERVSSSEAITDRVSGTDSHTPADINDDKNKVESVREMVDDRLQTSKTGTPVHNEVTFKKDHGRTTGPLGASHEPGTIPGSSL